MALYRWRKSTISSRETQYAYSERTIVALASKIAYQLSNIPTWTGSYYDFSNAIQTSGNTASYYVAFTPNPTVYYIGTVMKGWDSGFEYWMTNTGDTMVSRTDAAGTFVGYVYSTNSSAYPNGGVSGSYYYDQMQKVDFTATIDVPQLAMQGNQITVSWSAVDGADGYILERKANTDTDWTQVYSGANTSFEEAVGTWTSVQYRVKAGVSGTYGDYTTSTNVPVVSASAVVISGSDGDLGTLVNDVSYTVSSDGSTELTVVETINGTETRTYTATNGATNKIPVVDLPTGYGTIKITASTNPGSGVVSVERNWTYTKAAITFPDAGSRVNLTQQGKTIWAKTIAEAVRTPGIWGGNLGLALQKLMGAVLYNSNKVAKYTEVKVNLATAKVGQEINLPYNGKMIPHIVLHIGNPNPSLYDASCDGVWLMQKVAQLNTDWARGEGATNEFTKSSMVYIVGGERNRYDKSVADAMKNVKIPYCVGGGSAEIKTLADGYSCRTFLLGAYEAGYNTTDDPDLPIDGAHLQGMNRSMARNCWLRTVVTGTSTDVYYANGYTQLSKIKATFNGNQYQTTFIMPTTFSATYYVDIKGNLHDEQEYEEAGTFTDISGGAISVPRIETGFYVGTNSSSSVIPVELHFSGKPVMLLLCYNGNSAASEYWGIPAIRANNYIGFQYASGADSDSLEWGENTVTIGGKRDFNYSGRRYYWFAIVV